MSLGAAKLVFLELLAAYTLQGRRVGPNPGSNYAPTVFAADPKAKDFTKDTFTQAMNSLFSEARLWVKVIGPKSKQREVLGLEPPE